MTHRKLSSIALMVSALLAAPSLQAWNNFGHMAVAYVAYMKLDAATRAKVDHLLSLNPYFMTKWQQQLPAGTAAADRGAFLFMLAATWPDAIKRDNQYHNDGAGGGDRPTGPEAARNTGYDDFNRHKYWHFVDHPFSKDGTPLPAIPVPNAETQIAVFRQVLNSTQAEALKSYDLVWLLHLVGDVHQPLHATARVSQAHPNGDAGGNDVGFCSATAPKCTGELHAYWDDILGTSNDPAAVKTFAAALKIPSVTKTSVGSGSKWIGESFKLAKADVYAAPVGAGDGPYHANQKYADRAHRVAAQRVALAGARLAAILKAELQ